MESNAVKISIGAEFRCGPVVDAIVANLTVAEKFRLLRQIKKMNRKRSQISTKLMSGWQDSIERAFNKQQNICDSINYEETIPNINLNGEQCIIPGEWLNKQLNKLKQLLLLCPNVTGIHLFNRDYYQNAIVNEKIFDFIFTAAPKLQSLTFQVKHMVANEESMRTLRLRNDVTDYTADTYFNRTYTRAFIELNPNMRTIYIDDLEMDFELKALSIQNNGPTRMYRSGSIVALCSYFQKYNANYRKSTANGIWLREIELDHEASQDHFEEVVNLFTELECISIHCDVVDIDKLKVMTNVRKLRLRGSGGIYGESEHTEKLLSHLSKLEQLDVDYTCMGDNALLRLYNICPHLKRLSIGPVDYDYLTKETLREVAKLSKLEYFEYYIGIDTYLWKDKKDVEANRRILNS